MASGGRFAVLHVRDGRLLAVEAVNAPAEFMAGRRLIRDQATLDLERLADTSVALEQLAVPAAPEAPASPEKTRAKAGPAKPLPRLEDFAEDPAP